MALPTIWQDMPNSDKSSENIQLMQTDIILDFWGIVEEDNP